jgi:hypothetical protein
MMDVLAELIPIVRGTKSAEDLPNLLEKNEKKDRKEKDWDDECEYMGEIGDLIGREIGREGEKDGSSIVLVILYGLDEYDTEPWKDRERENG